MQRSIKISLIIFAIIFYGILSLIIIYPRYVISITPDTPSRINREDTPLISDLIPDSLRLIISFKATDKVHHKQYNRPNHYLLKMEQIQIKSEDDPNRIYQIDSILQQLDFVFTKHCENYYYDSTHHTATRKLNGYIQYIIDLKNLIEYVRFPRHVIFTKSDLKKTRTFDLESKKIKTIYKCD